MFMHAAISRYNFAMTRCCLNYCHCYLYIYNYVKTPCFSFQAVARDFFGQIITRKDTSDNGKCLLFILYTKSEILCILQVFNCIHYDRHNRKKFAINKKIYSLFETLFIFEIGGRVINLETQYNLNVFFNQV